MRKVAYTERDSKVGFWLRWLCSTFFVFTRTLCTHNGRILQTKKLRSRLAKIPTFESRSVCRSFLLLELVIALLLITLCVMPFVNIPSGVQKEEMLFLQRLELQRLGDRTCSLIKERIYTKEISWEQLSRSKDKQILLIHDVVSLPLKELSKHRFIRQCYVLRSEEKKGQDNLETRLVTVRVSFQRAPGSKLRLFSNKGSRKKIWYDYQFLVKQEKVKV